MSRIVKSSDREKVEVAVEIDKLNYETLVSVAEANGFTVEDALNEALSDWLVRFFIV